LWGWRDRHKILGNPMPDILPFSVAWKAIKYSPNLKNKLAIDRGCP
jgi:hypothetical protein